MFRPILIALSAFFVTIAHGQVTPIANAPLGTSGTSSVRPNIMLLLDDSSSLVNQYLPDSAKTAALCDKAASTSSGDTPKDRLNSVAEPCPQYSGNLLKIGPEPAMQPRPPSYSPDVNLQYYNPEVRYLPPVKANSTSYPSMTGTSTTQGGVLGATPSSPNWRAIPMDGYGVQDNTAFNIEAWPLSYYCNQQNPAVCAADTTYNFPERASSTTDLTAKRTPVVPNNNAATFGAPHYYRLGVSEYCQEEQLINCVKSTAPTLTYLYPARLRFCTDINKAVCQKNYDAAPTRGYIVPSYIYVPVNGTTSPVPATGTLMVHSLTNPNSRGSITMLSINGQEVGSISLNSTINTLADSIASKLNTIPGYTATASGTTIRISSNTTGPTNNGIPVVIDAPIVPVTRASYIITLTNANLASLPDGSSLNELLINGANIAASPISNSPSAKRFSEAAVLSWATNNGTNGYRAFNVSTSGNNIRFTLEKTNLNDYTLSDNSPTASVTVTAPASGNIRLSASTTFTSGVATSATFSYNSGIVATNASGVLSGGANDTSTATRGQWSRVSIVPLTPTLAPATYPRGIDRTDCVNNFCTYSAEMTNFANWFAYYRFRLNTIKTVSGQAFGGLNSNYRVGFHTITGTPGMLGVAPFDATDTSSTAQRTRWFNRLYTHTANNNTTPSRSGLGDVGRYYGGKDTNMADPIEFSCQKNYTIFVTDGYWNGTNAKDLSGNFMDLSYDSDSTNPRSSRESGVFDGNNMGGTLADVAQYYYDIDLRPTGTNSKNNVPTNSRDNNNAQHMNTYTLGLGVDGLMTYRKDYMTATTGDFSKITSGDTGCSWESSLSRTCNWPIPIEEGITTVDDLWHAAVNGRGQYFSARTPKEAADGLREAVGAVAAITGAAAASATSSPNITASDNFIYSSTYETGVWSGEVVAQCIDPSSGAVGQCIDPSSGVVSGTVAWRASEQINAQADALGGNDNARTLLTMNTALTAVNKAKPFKFSDLTTDERAWFTNRCTTGQFAQCADNLILPERRPAADNAENVVNYLRGRNDSDVFTAIPSGPFGYLQIFREARSDRLGDTVNAVPHYISKPLYTFDFDLPAGHETYQTFIARVHPTCAALDTACQNTRRPGTLYMAANDGMLHALDGNTGVERFGYVPRTTMPEMWRLADKNYDRNHRYFVDGSPVSMDISTDANATTKVWKTILVGGYRSGGSGYYAMDVTNPRAPQVLWETCNSATLCNNVIPDMGLSFGNPVLTRMPLSHPSLAGKWVVLVSSGYNNVPGVSTQPTAGVISGLTSTGQGFLFVLDPMSGALLTKYSTNEGTASAPINLGKISTFSPKFYFDGVSNLAFGGDLKGNIWRFDLTKESTATGAVRKLATLMKGTVIQPITAKIEVGLLPNRSEPVLFAATGQYLNVDDVINNASQSLYAILDAYSSTSPPSTDNFYGSPRTTTAPKPFVQQLISNTAAGVRTISQNDVDWSTKSGWYTDFPDFGERVSLDPSLVLGTLTVATNVVNSTTADACEIGGYSWLYQLDYTTGGKIATAPSDAVAYKVPGALVVGTVVVRLPSGVLKIITTTATGAKIPYGLNTGTSSLFGRRLSWREISQ